MEPSREFLESLAIDAVCPCLYYELVDTIGEVSDEDLIIIINGDACEICVVIDTYS